jgi:hypothetical protein
MSTDEIIIYGFLSFCLLMSIIAVIKPTMLTKLNLLYFRWTFRLMGYEIELKPISPNKPEKIARLWAIVMCLAFAAFLFFAIFIAPPK